MKQTAANQLTALNQSYKELDESYHQYAKACGLSDTAFWILYSIYERETPCTQRELCADWSYAPQTLNTALKGIEAKGWLRLDPIPENRKNKLVVLTPDGLEAVERIVAPLTKAEQASFQQLTDQERTTLLTVTQRYAQLLRNETENLIHTSSED